MEEEENVRDNPSKGDVADEQADKQDDETYQNLMASLPKDIAQLQSLLMHNLIANQQHQQQIKQLIKKNQELEEEVESLHEESARKFRDLEDDLDYNTGRKEELKEEVESLKEELDGEIEGRKLDTKRSNFLIQSYTGQCRDLVTENKELVIKLEKTLKEKLRFQEILKDISDEKQKVELDLDNLKNEHLKLQEKNQLIASQEDMDNENRELKEQLESSKSEKSKAIEDLKRENNSLKSKISILLTCELCNSTFSDKSLLKGHIELHHTDKQQDSEIDKINKKDQLLEKEKAMLSKLNKQKSIIYKTVLKMKQIESEDVVKCFCKGLCNIDHFKYRWVKPESDKFISRLDKILQEDQIFPVQDENKFTCHQCNKTFTDEGKLRNHKETEHVGCVNYICDHCGETFTEEVTLRNHKETVHGICLNFQSQQCEQSYVKQANFRNHMETAHLTIYEM